MTTRPQIAWLWPSGVEIAPFGDAVGDCFVGTLPLREWQRDAFEACGLEVRRVDSPADIPADGPALAAPDNLWLSRRALRAFLRACEGRRQAARAALPQSLYMERYGALQEAEPAPDGGHVFRLWYLPEGGEPAADAPPVTVAFREKRLDWPMPRHIMGAPHLTHPVTTTLFMHVEHWVHLVWANLLGIQVRWVEWIVGHPLRAALRVLRGLRPGRSATRWAVLSNFNNIGPGCDIHPTARLEGCILGRNVRVGAYSLLRGAVLGDDVVVEDRVQLAFSTLAAGCYVSHNSVVIGCASFPESDLCANGMQLCMVGRNVALTSRVTPLDSQRGRAIQVPHRGALVSTGVPALGAAFGHRCFVGPDVYIQPGRAVPNDTVIVMAPERPLGRIPDVAQRTPGEPVVIEDGTLRALRPK